MALVFCVSRKRGRDFQWVECSSSIVRRQKAMIAVVPNNTRLTIMKANMALVSLQSVVKEDLSGCESKYSAMKARQLPVALQSHTPTRVAQAAKNSASRAAIVVKNIGPSKNTGSIVTPAYTVQTQATARAPVAFEGTSTSAFEKPLMTAATKPMIGIDITICRTREAIRKRRKKTSSKAFESSSSLVLNFIVVFLVHDDEFTEL